MDTSNGDIVRFMESLGHAGGTYRIEPLSRLRKMIADRMAASSRTIPHFPLEMMIDMREALKARDAYCRDVGRVSVNDVILKASAIALKRVPELNAGLTPEGVARYGDVNVAVAVAIEEGLMTPVVKQVDSKPLKTLAAEMKDLAARAQTRRLKPDEYGGATFTVSNLGMFGISRFGSIINEGQAAILSVGCVQQVLERGADGEIADVPKIAVTLTCDHRVVDGATGARWLNSFAESLGQPAEIFA